MSAYALAHLRHINPHLDILEYLERIQTTLAPFSGRFLVHGGAVEIREGTWPGQVVLIEFPSVAEARGWYESTAYQSILPLRTNHIEGDAIIVDGIRPGHEPAEMAAAMRQAWGLDAQSAGSSG